MTKRSNCKTNYFFLMNVEYRKCSISDNFSFFCLSNGQLIGCLYCELRSVSCLVQMLNCGVHFVGPVAVTNTVIESITGDG
jgi:hypothetical protein